MGISLGSKEGIEVIDPQDLSPTLIALLTNIQLQNLTQTQQLFVTVNLLKAPYVVNVLSEIPDFVGSGLQKKVLQESRPSLSISETVLVGTRSIQLALVNTAYVGVGNTVHASPNSDIIVQLKGFMPLSTVKIYGFGGQLLTTITCDGSGSALWTTSSGNVVSGYSFLIPNGQGNGTYTLTADDNSSLDENGSNQFPAQNTITIP